MDSFGQFPEYARVLVKLSRLYQETQRVQDRAKIDDQLRARFARADTGYFVVRYLHGESTRAISGAEVASANSIVPY